MQLSNAYLLKGLGYKGLGDTNSATENLKKAVELSASNLWANVELNIDIMNSLPQPLLLAKRGLKLIVY